MLLPGAHLLPVVEAPLPQQHLQRGACVNSVVKTIARVACQQVEESRGDMTHILLSCQSYPVCM